MVSISENSCHCKRFAQPGGEKGTGAELAEAAG